MSEITLIVARHGNTFNSGDVILRVGARTDLPLTEQGHEQGRRLGESLLKKGLTPGHIYYAPLRRTYETATDVASVFSQNTIEMSAEEFLMELDYGQDDGLPENEVLVNLGLAEIPCDESVVQDEERLKEIGRSALEAWDSRRILPKVWGGLSNRVSSLGRQWREFADSIVQKAQTQPVVAVTSNGVARFALDLLSDEGEKPVKQKLSTGAYGVFRFNGSVWRLVEWNVR